MVFTYITCKSVEEANTIAHHLVQNRMAAAVNIFPIKSVYYHEGGTREIEEASLIVQTIESKLGVLTSAVRNLHSYKVPCIASFALHRVNDEYKGWLASCIG